jgi:hypothetical protein
MGTTRWVVAVAAMALVASGCGGIGGEYGQGDVNCSLLDDPAIDEAMTAASTIPAGDERSQAWADVHGVINGYTTTWDLTYSSLE